MACSGIYAIQRKDSAECYIGSAVNIARRWAKHGGALSDGKHNSRHMQNVYNKHGADAFEFVILEPVTDKSDLLAREQAWLDRFSPVYNTAPVAGSLLGFRHSAETRARMSKAQLKREPHSAEARAKMSASWKARPPFSAEHRAKLSAAFKARPRRSAETRAKMSASGKARPPATAEARAQISATLKARWAKTREAV